MSLVLSIFPGIDLLGLAFELEGFTVVHARDAMFGGDERQSHYPRGRFDGLIGGPPCQKHSTASAIEGTEAEDLIPEFVRVADETGAAWGVMENVTGAWDHPAVPKRWQRCVLRDWDCGGETNRTRLFYTWPFPMPLVLRRDGRPQKSVMATTWKRGKSESKYITDKGFLPGDLPIEEYGRLQGCEALATQLRGHPAKFSRSSIVHLLGNGVPLSMGLAIARAVKQATRKSA